jgi:drug/metabolite transporter (DMT)-like permease
VGILLSLAAAVTYGSADFLGGLVSRRVNVLVVVLVSQALGSTALALCLILFSNEPLSARALEWGGAAGVAGTIGIVLFYRALAEGRMSIVAPVTAVEAACVPVLFGIVIGERPSAIALAGVILSIPAVALVSAAEDVAPAIDEDVSASRRRWSHLVTLGIPQAVVAGLCFGAFFVLVERAGPAAGLWPIVGVRIVSTIAMLGAIAIARPSFRNVRPNLALLAVVGSLDVTANVFFLVATHKTLLSIAAVLTSLYPAVTVVLAAAFLKERLRAIQLVGLVAAIAGIALISVG